MNILLLPTSIQHLHPTSKQTSKNRSKIMKKRSPNHQKNSSKNNVAQGPQKMPPTSAHSAQKWIQGPKITSKRRAREGSTNQLFEVLAPHGANLAPGVLQNRPGAPFLSILGRFRDEFGRFFVTFGMFLGLSLVFGPVPGGQETGDEGIGTRADIFEFVGSLFTGLGG